MKFNKLITVLSLFAIIIGYAQTPLSTAFSNSYASESKKDYKGAINSILGVHKDDNYYTSLRLGWLYYLSGNNASSIENYKNALKVKPNSVEALMGEANVLAIDKKWEELNKIYSKVLSIDPNNTVANYRLGLSKYYAKQYDIAEDYVSKVLKLYPFDYDANLLMAGIRFSQGKLSEAKHFYQVVLLINPNDPTAKSMMKSL